uniref:Uncharacterized protein n=1 Tax=Physcomitrium patens TaxID=3218 RepID=A0A7I4EWG4_PHYPA
MLKMNANEALEIRADEIFSCDGIASVNDNQLQQKRRTIVFVIVVHCCLRECISFGSEELLFRVPIFRVF